MNCNKYLVFITEVIMMQNYGYLSHHSFLFILFFLFLSYSSKLVATLKINFKQRIKIIFCEQINIVELVTEAYNYLTFRISIGIFSQLKSGKYSGALKGFKAEETEAKGMKLHIRQLHIQPYTSFIICFNFRSGGHNLTIILSVSQNTCLFPECLSSLYRVFNEMYILQAGMDWYQLEDWYAATYSVAIIGLFECVGLTYFYGVLRS